MYCYTCTIQYKEFTRLKYNKIHCYTCTTQYKLLSHMQNIIEYSTLLHVCNTIQYNTTQCTVTRVQYNTRYCYTCTIQYKVLLHVYNTIQGTVTCVQYNVLFHVYKPNTCWFHLYIEAPRVTYKDTVSWCSLVQCSFFILAVRGNMPIQNSVF